MYDIAQFNTEWKRRAFVERLRRVKPLIDDKVHEKALGCVTGYEQKLEEREIDSENARLLCAIQEAGPQVASISTYQNVAHMMDLNRKNVEKLKEIELEEKYSQFEECVMRARSTYMQHPPFKMPANRRSKPLQDTSYQKYISDRLKYQITQDKVEGNHKQPPTLLKTDESSQTLEDANERESCNAIEENR